VSALLLKGKLVGIDVVSALLLKGKLVDSDIGVLCFSRESW
jgi:hypothetical protein